MEVNIGLCDTDNIEFSLLKVEQNYHDICGLYYIYHDARKREGNTNNRLNCCRRGNYTFQNVLPATKNFMVKYIWTTGRHIIYRFGLQSDDYKETTKYVQEFMHVSTARPTRNNAIRNLYILTCYICYYYNTEFFL